VYTQFFNLREMPFSITPDPAYLYMSPRHQEALGHLLYGTGQYGGFVQLTGEVGTGKTTVVRTLLEQKLDGVEVAMIHNPRQSEREFVQSICDELRVDYPRDPPPTQKDLVDSLNLHLLANHAQGRRTVLIIDEAQNLAPGVLEQVRLLTNLETHKEKLLRIMLVGQPELSEVLASPELRQLASRITARYHLTPLEEDETGEYIRHRLGVAGTQEELFPPAAVTEVHRHTRGVPRLINVLCDRALLGAYGKHQHRVTAELVRGAAAEVVGREGASALAERRNGGWPRLDRRVRAGLPMLSLTWFEGLLIALALMIGGALIYQTVLRYVHEPQADIAAAVSASAPRAETPPPAAAAAAPAPSAAIAPAPPAPPAAPVAPAPAPSGTTAVADRPADSAAMKRVFAAGTSLPQVMGRLIRLWDAGIRVGNGENVCRALRRQGFECYRTQGVIKDLRQMDRPAVLTLTDASSGATRYALVTQLTDTRAQIDTARGSADVPLDELSRAWTGEMLVLWRRETKDVQLAPGQRGPSILWLRERLAQMMGKPATRSDRYDEALKLEVRTFQEARELEADGVVGIRTRIALSDPAPGTPTLRFKP
jgi:general secretion pathway protein A